MMKPRISLFAEHEREDRRTKIGDPLVGLTKHVDIEALAASIDAAAPRPSRAKGGRPPYPTVLMVKILVLQQLYNLADDALEYQLLDRRSFLQFLDLTESSSIPDAKTIWLFRDRLAQAGAGTLVFEQVQQQLQLHGYMARCGQIVDASLVQAPVQRNKREEADTVKEGMMPLGWKPHKRAEGCRRALDKEARQELLWLQAARQRGQALQAAAQNGCHACRRGRHHGL